MGQSVFLNYIFKDSKSSYGLYHKIFLSACKPCTHHKQSLEQAYAVVYIISIINLYSI